MVGKMDKGRLGLLQVGAVLGWKSGTLLSWSWSDNHIAFLETSSGGHAMDDSGRVLVPVPARRLLHLIASDSVLMIADCAPVPSLRIYSLPTAYLALTKKEGTSQNGN
jgi:hypothetical protein